jgi:hypothetical protein
MAEAESIGRWYWIASVAIATVAVLLHFRDWQRRAVVMGLAVALHPGWWLSARIGDCGELLRAAAPIGTGAVLVLAVVPLRLPNWLRAVHASPAERLFDDRSLRTHRGCMLVAVSSIVVLLASWLVTAFWSPHEPLVEPEAIKRVQMGMTKQEVEQAVGRLPDRAFFWDGGKRLAWEWDEGRSNFGVSFDEQGLVEMKHYGTRQDDGFLRMVGEGVRK